MPTYNTNFKTTNSKSERLDRIPTIDEFVDRNFSTLFIVERAGNTYETQRIQRDKIGKKIDTALKNGKLWSDKGKYRFGDLIAWILTKKEFANAADGFLPIGHASAELTMPSFNLRASGFSLPVTIEECRDKLRVAYQELNTTLEENSQLRAQVAELLVDRAKVQKRSEDGKVYGAQGGRGNAK